MPEGMDNKDKSSKGEDNSSRFSIENIEDENLRSYIQEHVKEDDTVEDIVMKIAKKAFNVEQLSGKQANELGDLRKQTEEFVNKMNTIEDKQETQKTSTTSTKEEGFTDEELEKYLKFADVIAKVGPQAEQLGNKLSAYDKEIQKQRNERDIERILSAWPEFVGTVGSVEAAKKYFDPTNIESMANSKIGQLLDADRKSGANIFLNQKNPLYAAWKYLAEPKDIAAIVKEKGTTSTEGGTKSTPPGDAKDKEDKAILDYFTKMEKASNINFSE